MDKEERIETKKELEENMKKQELCKNIQDIIETIKEAERVLLYKPCEYGRKQN